MTDDKTPSDTNVKDDELCPCGSEKPYLECCKKEYDDIMATRAKLKAALSDPNQAKELAKLIKQAKT